MAYRTHLRLTVLAFAATGWHGTAAADPAPAIVEVVGTTPLPGLDVARSRIPANVQALDGDAVNAPGAATLPDALNRRLGSVYVNEIQGNPIQPDVNYRGFTAS
ncbi:MAG: TonB-dependent receptor, partial [Massilia sp.]|nr:TonB-dependent receptor [Massilia sp.]